MIIDYFLEVSFTGALWFLALFPENPEWLTEMLDTWEGVLFDHATNPGGATPWTGHSPPLSYISWANMYLPVSESLSIIGYLLAAWAILLPIKVILFVREVFLP